VKRKMDKLDMDREYESIYSLSAGWLLLSLNIYILFVSSGSDFLEFSFIRNPVTRLLIQALIQVVASIGVHILILLCVRKYKQNKWIKEHKHKYLQGEWLHIHDKDNVRIGMVTIKQSYDNIQVTDGYNVSPCNVGIKEKPLSKWSYCCAELYPSQLAGAGVEFLGCYVSSKPDSSFVLGVHNIDSIDHNDEGFPYIMSGQFLDTLKRQGNETIDIQDKAGAIYFFKMTPAIKKYLQAGTHHEQIAAILNEDSLKDEPYVKKLRQIVNKIVAAKGKAQEQEQTQKIAEKPQKGIGFFRRLRYKSIHIIGR